MFESAEMRQEVDKATYEEAVPKLREELLDAQYDLLERKDFPVLVIIAGDEFAGKSETVQTLNEWMDPRHIHTHGFLLPTDEEAQRPPMYRFWRALPPKGTIGVFFGSWYTLPIAARAFSGVDDEALDRSINRIRHLERMLHNEGVLILKFFLHVSKREQRKRMKALEKDPDTRWRVSKAHRVMAERYDEVRSAAETMIRETSTGEAPWIVIDGYDHRYRTLTVGQILLEAVRRRLDQPATSALVTAAPVVPQVDNVRLVRNLDLSQRLEKDEYRKALEKYQERFGRMMRSGKFRKHALVLAFEGSDAAGKGGAVRRVTAALDARTYRIVPVAAPTEEEREQPYLWRFWRHAPGKGGIVIFDRTWYGRVLVERVEGYCSDADWMRAYDEINEFEEQLVDNGTIVCKFWLQISKEEQLRRFQEREQTGFKRFKITEEDWRNRDKWGAYEQAVADMVDRTSTSLAPWTLVEANDKYFARVKVLETICDAVERRLS
jgi:polyphosphate:AMP phosphotransferase